MAASPTPGATTPGVTAVSGPITRRQFASTLLRSQGWPDTPQTEAALIAWMASENTSAMWNPFATTLRTGPGTKWPGWAASTPLAGNSAGVQNYPTVDQGIWAWGTTLSGNSRYGPILDALNAGNGPKIIAAVSASPWGSHPTTAMYNAALSDPSIGAVVIGSGTIAGSAPIPSDAGAAIPLGPFGGITDALNPLGVFEKLVSYVGLLFSWATWKRVLAVLGGVMLVALGVSMVNRDTFAQVAGDVGKVAAVAA